jgi:hypothetical protein
MADDRAVLDEIGKLVAEEETLLQQRSGNKLDAAGHERLKFVEEHLDQCWDLLRQRRAREEFGLDPNEAKARPVDVVENYKQ